jgi:hypothetical protein
MVKKETWTGTGSLNKQKSIIFTRNEKTPPIYNSLTFGIASGIRHIYFVAFLI